MERGDGLVGVSDEVCSIVGLNLGNVSTRQEEAGQNDEEDAGQ
jgi:hypothetical protein